MSIVLTTAALAYVETGGYKNCGELIAYTHARFSVDGFLRGPGAPVAVYFDYASGWHVDEANGVYAGDWFARGYNSLDLSQTYAACRNYG
jgi:hypothetical protein